MAALTAERDIYRKGPESTAAVPLITVPLKAAAKVYKGSLVAVDATGYGIAGAGIAATGLIVVGVATQTVDNTSGASGALSVDVQRGTFPFANLGGDPVAQTEFGKTVFVDDDQTIRKTSNTSTRSNAGVFWGFDENSLALVEVGLRSATGV